jgi:hypothetical protein
MTIRTKLAAALAPVLLTAALVGCSTAATTGSEATTAAQTVAVQSAAEVLAANRAAHTTEAGSDNARDIALTGESVTITEAGTYRLTGTLTDGRVTVTAPDATVTLVLDGVDISSSSGAAIAATEVGELVVVLADGSTNTLSDTDSHAADADVNAALFSAGDLTVAGGGALAVEGNGNDGIASKDGLVVQSGTITVDAADDGLRGKDYVVVSGGALTVTAGGDGVKADNTEDADAGYVSISDGTLDITAQGDGVDAATDLVVTGDTIEAITGGGHGASASEDVSSKGLKSGVITVLAGGESTVDSADDAVHSDGTVHVDGATVNAASGDDGVHAESALEISGGVVNVTASVEGLEAADIAVKGGDVTVVSSDDGVNAAGGSADQAAQGGRGGGEQVGAFTAVVSGGTLVIDAGGDGFDSNGTASITGGTVVVNGPTMNGNGALDVNGDFTISGGVLLAAGSAGMVVAPGADSPQAWLSAAVSVQAGTTLHVVDPDGTAVATFVTSKDIGNLVYSSSAITTGRQYEIRTGGTASGNNIGGLATSGDLTSTTSATTTTAGEAPTPGQMPGRR